MQREESNDRIALNLRANNRARPDSLVVFGIRLFRNLNTAKDIRFAEKTNGTYNPPERMFARCLRVVARYGTKGLEIRFDPQSSRRSLFKISSWDQGNVVALRPEPLHDSGYDLDDSFARGSSRRRESVSWRSLDFLCFRSESINTLTYNHREWTSFKNLITFSAFYAVNSFWIRWSFWKTSSYFSVAGFCQQKIWQDFWKLSFFVSVHETILRDGRGRRYVSKWNYAGN